VSLYRRNDSPNWYTLIRWKGYPVISLCTGTASKARATAIERTLFVLKGNGRRDILDLLAAQRLRLPDVHEAYLRDPAALEQRVQVVASPTLGPLVDDWLAWLRSPGVLSPKTRRPYAPSTVERYSASWTRLLALLPRGREASLSDLTRGFVADFRAARKKARREGATVNRDLCALSAFFTWLEEERGESVTRPHFRHEEESAGRERWLSAEELRRLLEAVPAPWRPFFALMAYTGLRLGEVVGKDGAPALRWGDVRLAERRLTVQSRTRRLKTSGSARDVPIPDSLVQALATHRVAYPGGPADPVFPPPFTYGKAQKVFGKGCETAELHDVRVHDLRHTFGVHWVQAGLPLPRLQKILGHATPAMTLRYARHAPEAFFTGDAAAMDASLSGATDREAEAVRKAVVQRAETA
jgi:integrase